MREWTNSYNSFNSFKALMWREQFEGIAKQEFLPPVSVDTDPINACNYNCIWCNATEYMKNGKGGLSESHLIKLADFYKGWGVHSTCIAGGGEPLLSKGLIPFLERLNKNGIESGIITNGSLMDKDIIKAMAKYCRWVGISMDAGSSLTYAKVKGIKYPSMFHVVLDNIDELINKIHTDNSKCEVTYKFLLHPLNSNEIYLAVQWAKRLGVDSFHLRPVGWDNIGKEGDIDFSIDSINAQLEEAFSLEDDSFKIYGVRHKFDPNMKKKVNFKRCWASPLIATFGADGNCHMCFDMRGKEEFILCEHDPDPAEILKVWNSAFHKSMIDHVKIEECPRCTFGAYNEMVEQVFIGDRMCRYFP